MLLNRARQRRLPAVAWRDCQRPGLGAAWMQLLIQHASRSHIHGISQLFLPTMRRRMRLLWSLALLCACSALIYVCYLLSARYQLKHFQTVIAKVNGPMQKMAFPVLIICNKNRLNWARLPEVLQRHNVSIAQQPLLERILTAYDALSFRHFDLFAPFADEPGLSALNHLNFTELVIEMAWRCDELVLECSWQTQPLNCCALFRPRRLPQGMCLAFNEAERRRSGEFGAGTGLLVRLLINERKHAPGNRANKGFVLTIVEPSVWFGYPIEIVPGARTSIAVKAVYHYYDEYTYTVPSQKRRCVQDYEHDSQDFKTLQGQKYMLENCRAECHQLYMLRYCNCTLDLFYPPSDHRACQLIDLPCLAAHNHKLQNYEDPDERPFLQSRQPGMDCNCLHNCKSLTLLPELRRSALKPRERLSSNVTLNVFYKSNNMLIYKTSLRYTWLDLIVSFGGICQLCLGCSIVSLIELCYFGLVDVTQFCWQRHVAQRPHF